MIARKLTSGNYRYSIKKKDEKGVAREKYIPREDQQVAENLAMRHYAKQRIKDLEREKQILNEYIDFCCKERHADRYLKMHPGVGRLVYPHLQQHEKYIEDWANEKYRRSKKNPEQLKYSTVIPGLTVRRKADADWISRLVYFGIPLRYEEEFIINGIEVHPDITALNITSLEPVYIEHQGGWDQIAYVSKLSQRAELLQKAGIIPWKNFKGCSDYSRMI